MSSNSSIFVRGYPQSTKRQQLESLFERFGTIKQVKMVKNFAFVTYANFESAKAAVEQLHETKYKKDKLTVQLSGKNKPRREQAPPRAKEGDKCNACLKQGHWARDCPQKREINKRDRSERQRRERSRDRKDKKQPEKEMQRKKRSRSSSSSSSSSNGSSQSNKNRKDRKQRKQRRNSASSSKSSRSSSSSSSQSRSSKD